jgi:YVTN family beta-propeller protein
VNIIEIHLILNHIPILGVAFVSLYLLIATIFNNTFMQKVSLWILLCVSLLTQSASNTLTIFDTVSRKIVADIAGIPDVHAVAVAPDLGKVFATSATANQVMVIDAHTHAIIARIPTGDGPDGLIYDQADHKVFVADEAGQNDAVIDARTNQRITEIPLGGDAGDIEYDALPSWTAPTTPHCSW